MSFVISTTSVTYAQKNIPEKSSTKRLESQDPGKDNIYGWQIMTDYERDTYKKQIVNIIRLKYFIIIKNSTKRRIK